MSMTFQREIGQLDLLQRQSAAALERSFQAVHDLPINVEPTWRMRDEAKRRFRKLVAGGEYYPTTFHAREVAATGP